jgi:hypothetical protein
MNNQFTNRAFVYRARFSESVGFAITRRMEHAIYRHQFFVTPGKLSNVEKFARLGNAIDGISC